MPFDPDVDPSVRAWFDELPEPVQARVQEYPPDEPFLLTATDHRVRIYAYTESENDSGEVFCDTCQVLVLQEDNGGKLHMDRRVFGIRFEDLKPIPDGWEPSGDPPIETMDPGFAEFIRKQQQTETH